MLQKFLPVLFGTTRCCPTAPEVGPPTRQERCTHAHMIPGPADFRDGISGAPAIAGPVRGAPPGMDNVEGDDREHATYDQPLNGPRKGGVGPAVLVIGVLLGVLAIFALITWLRYTT